MSTNPTSILRMETERQAAMNIVHCTGRVVIDSWAEFSVTVRGLIAEGKPIRVDLAEVTRVDSTGIGAFVSVWAAAKKRNCDLKFIRPNKHVADVVGITGLHGMFEGHEAEERDMNTALGS